MGYWYMYGTSNSSSFENALKQVDEKMSEVEPNDDGSLEFEIVIKGKNEKRVKFTSQNGAEIKEIIKLNSI